MKVDVKIMLKELKKLILIGFLVVLVFTVIELVFFNSLDYIGHIIVSAIVHILFSMYFFYKDQKKLVVK